MSSLEGQLKDKNVKEVKEAEPVVAPLPPPAVELILRPLHEGHAISLAAKVKQPDGTVIDTVVESSSPMQELRLELTHLQEAVVRAKVRTVMVHDAEQSANIPKPYDEVFPPTPTGPEAKKSPQEQHRQQTQHGR